MILGDVRHKAAWVKEVDIMLRLQHPGDHLHQNRQLSLLVIVSMTYDVNCPELLKTLNNSPWFSTFPLRRRLMSAHSRGSWPRHQVPYKMMNYRPKHQFLENQHFLDMLELCVQASAAVKTKKRVVATTSSLVIYIQHQLSRFEMQRIKIIALSPNLCNSLHSKKRLQLHFSAFVTFPPHLLHFIRSMVRLTFVDLCWQVLVFFSPRELPTLCMEFCESGETINWKKTEN